MRELRKRGRSKREGGKEKDPERARGSRGSVCAHIGAAGEITSTGSVPVFGIGGKDK